MFAPSETTITPFLISRPASLALISFWVALGNAQSALMSHSAFESCMGSVAW